MATAPTDPKNLSDIQLIAARADLEVGAQKYDLAGRHATAAVLRETADKYKAELDRRR